jgi:hypothetical protein
MVRYLQSVRSTLRKTVTFVYDRSMRKIPGMMVTGGAHSKNHFCFSEVRRIRRVTPGDASDAGS